MSRFSFKIAYRSGSPNTDEQFLEDLCREGWDLVSMTDTQFALRRPNRKIADAVADVAGPPATS